jgi:hypothetical protein
MKAIGIVTLGCFMLWLASPIAARSDPGSAVWVARYDGPGNFLDIGQRRRREPRRGDGLRHGPERRRFRGGEVPGRMLDLGSVSPEAPREG